jgi:TPR repeat protein
MVLMRKHSRKRPGYWLIGAALLSSWTFASSADLSETVSELQEGRLYADAISLLESTTEESKDYAVAARLLGQVYRDGLGVEKSKEDAIRYYRIAAELGDPEAMYELGRAYETGAGVAASASSAYAWYDEAAQSHPEAALRYAEIALANEGKSGFVARHDPVVCLEYASKNGLGRAKYILAMLLSTGKGVGKDEERARALLEEAAPSNTEARTELAKLNHKEGRFEEAKRGFEEAYAGGDRVAAAYLGHYAENGVLQDENRELAIEYYEDAEGGAWIAESRRRLTEHFRSVEIFGIRMYGSTRREVVAKIGDKGIPRVGGAEYFDAFDIGSRIEGGPDMMTVAYAPASPNYVAEIGYQFKPERRSNIRKIFDTLVGSLSGEYGEPTVKDRQKGNSRARWTTGSTTIVLSHIKGNDFLTLTYQLRPYYDDLAKYVADKTKREMGGLDDTF